MDRAAAEDWIRAHLEPVGAIETAHERINKLPPADPWFARLRDAYLEPWGPGLLGAFALAISVGAFAHTFAWARQRDALPVEARREFDRRFPIVLRRAVARTLE